jgi:twinkle protein
MISHATAEHFGVRIGVSTRDGETPVYYLFPRYRSGKLIGWKKKQTDKNIKPPYVNYGGQNSDLFGAHLCKPTGKKLYITEGEFDAMALYQVLTEQSTITGWEPSIVSLSDGAASAVKSIILSQELLDGYEEIVLVFDNDEAGIKARDTVCKTLAGKVSYVTLPLKDSNDMLLAGRGVDLKWQVLTHAKKYQPDGVVNARDLWDRYKTVDNNVCYPYPSFLSDLNDKTYGARPGSIVTITSGSGCGKTQFMRELMYHYYNATPEKIAGMYLEEDVSDTLSGLLSLDLGKRITLPDVKVNEDDERDSFDRLFGSGRISLYDYFGGMDDSNLLSKLRYFAVTGHKFIFLDHLSIVVSEYAAKGGERERIDTLMTKLAKFVKEFNIVLFLVVHLRKTDNSSTSFEMGAPPTLDDLRGSAALKQLSWDVLGLSRNQQHKDIYCANTTEVSVLKCRFTGRTGVADYIYFDDKSGRFMPVDKPQNYREMKRLKSV